MTDPAEGVLEARQPEFGLTRRTFASLWVRNFRLFFWGQLISNSGNWLTIVALTLLVLHRTGSGLAVGLLSACQFGPLLVLSAWAGLIADRSDKRRLLYITQSLEMAQSVVLAILAFVSSVPIGTFFAIALAGGCVLAFDNPGRRSFVNEMVRPDLVPNAVTLYSALVNLSRLFGQRWPLCSSQPLATGGVSPWTQRLTSRSLPRSFRCAVPNFGIRRRRHAVAAKYVQGCAT